MKEEFVFVSPKKQQSKRNVQDFISICQMSNVFVCILFWVFSILIWYIWNEMTEKNDELIKSARGFWVEIEIISESE